MEEQEWFKFSLSQAMDGLEDEDFPPYTESDLIENWQWSKRARWFYLIFLKPISSLENQDQDYFKGSWLFLDMDL